MSRILLLAAMAVLCGCHPPVRPQPASYDVPPPVARGDETPSTRVVDPPHSATDRAPSQPAAEELPKVPRSLAAVVTEVNGQLEDAFFAYDRAEAGPDALAALRRDAELLKPVLAEFPTLKVAVEGHCDERGSAEYNLALGDRRAAQAVALLQQFGVPASTTVPVSFGKEAPQCTGSAEACWRLNRRAHLVLREPYISSQ